MLLSLALGLFLDLLSRWLTGIYLRRLAHAFDRLRLVPVPRAFDLEVQRRVERLARQRHRWGGLRDWSLERKVAGGWPTEKGRSQGRRRGP